MSNLESVIFEIQVDKKILEQLLIDNENFKDYYDKLIKQDNLIKSLNDELSKYKKLNKELIDDNLELKQQTDELKQFKILYNQYCTKEDINCNDTELLKMKLKKLEDEKEKLSNDFEKQCNEFNRTLNELKKLNSNKLMIDELLEKTTQLQDELTRKQLELQLLQDKYNQLDIDNLNLEKSNKDLKKQLLIFEQKLNYQELEQYEYNLMKLKLQKLTNEKESLKNDYQRDLNTIRRNNDNNNKFVTTKKCIEDNMQMLRQWFKNEMKSYQQQQQPQSPTKDIEEDIRLLKEKIHILEIDKRNLMDGFEMERQVFRRILKDHHNHK